MPPQGGSPWDTLLASIDDALCVLDLEDDVEGRVVDAVCREANAAFVRQCGQGDPIGTRLGGLATGIGADGLARLAEVARTGQTARFVSRIEADDRWFEVYAARGGAAGTRRVSLLFRDVSQVRREARRKECLLRLGDALRPLDDPVRIQLTATRVLGEHLALSRVEYYDADGDDGLVSHGGYAEGVAPVTGRVRMDDFGGFVQRGFEAGLTLVVADVDTDPRVQADERAAYRGLQVRAFAAIPLVKGGRLVGVMALHQAAPREWPADEVALAEEVAERTWAALERARAEAALRASEEKYRTLFDSMDEGYCIIQMLHDADGTAVDWRFLEVNAAFERHNGLRDAVGRTIREMAPDIEPKWLRIYDHVARSGEARRFVEDSPALGRVFNLFAFRIGAPGAHTVAVIFSDITEHSRAEAALQESQERLRLVVENAREYAIFSMDPERRITSWNAGAERILGYPQDEAIGRSGDMIFTEEDCAAGAPDREAAQALAEGRAIDERWHVRRNGSRFWASGIMTPMHDRTGRVIGLVKIFRDQTSQLLAQEALELSRRELRQALAETELARDAAQAAAQAKDRFLAVLSHELRTPLTPLLLASQILARNDTLPADVLGALRIVERNARLEAHLVDDLLDVTRITTGKLEMHRVPIRLRDVVAAAVDVSMPDLEARGQRLLLQPVDDGDAMLGDVKRLQQVFWNLLKNASKFSPADGEIVLGMQSREGWVDVEVRDRGVGFQPAAAERIFAAFEQGSHEVTRRHGGLGLGLAIARAVVEAHGGRIAAESSGSGEGAVFRVSLPTTP